MGRMHAPGKGISQSALPYRRSVPQWLKLTPDEVKDQIFKLAKKGLTPSQIGVILRDSHGVAQVRFITGNKILRILKSKGMFEEKCWSHYVHHCRSLILLENQKMIIRKCLILTQIHFTQNRKRRRLRKVLKQNPMVLLILWASVYLNSVRRWKM